MSSSIHEELISEHEARDLATSFLSVQSGLPADLPSVALIAAPCDRIFNRGIALLIWSAARVSLEASIGTQNEASAQCISLARSQFTEDIPQWHPNDLASFEGVLERELFKLICIRRFDTAVLLLDEAARTLSNEAERSLSALLVERLIAAPSPLKVRQSAGTELRAWVEGNRVLLGATVPEMGASAARSVLDRSIKLLCGDPASVFPVPSTFPPVLAAIAGLSYYCGVPVPLATRRVISHEGLSNHLFSSHQDAALSILSCDPPHIAASMTRLQSDLVDASSDILSLAAAAHTSDILCALSSDLTQLLGRVRELLVTAYARALPPREWKIAAVYAASIGVVSGPISDNHLENTILLDILVAAVRNAAADAFEVAEFCRRNGRESVGWEVLAAESFTLAERSRLLHASSCHQSGCLINSRQSDIEKTSGQDAPTDAKDLVTAARALHMALLCGCQSVASAASATIVSSIACRCASALPPSTMMSGRTVLGQMVLGMPSSAMVPIEARNVLESSLNGEYALARFALALWDSLVPSMSDAAHVERAIRLGLELSSDPQILALIADLLYSHYAIMESGSGLALTLLSDPRLPSQQRQRLVTAIAAVPC
jgi:hypothetical protein